MTRKYATHTIKLSVSISQENRVKLAFLAKVYRWSLSQTIDNLLSNLEMPEGWEEVFQRYKEHDGPLVDFLDRLE